MELEIQYVKIAASLDVQRCVSDTDYSGKDGAMANDRVVKKRHSK